MQWIVLCVTLAVVESGDWSAILRAQQLFHELYGKKAEAAKTPQDKVLLARAIFEYAKTESNSELRRIAAEEANRLAIEARYAQLCYEIAKLQRQSDDSDPLLVDSDCDRLWIQAERTERLEQFDLMYESISKWLCVSSPPQLLSKKWEERTAEFLRRFPPPSRPLPRAIYSLRMPLVVLNTSTGLVLNVNGGSRSPGADIIIYELPAETNAQWLIERGAASSVRIRNVNSGLFLTVDPNAEFRVTQRMEQDEWSAWQLVPVQSGFVLINYASQLALTPSGKSSTSRVIVAPCDREDQRQRWALVPR